MAQCAPQKANFPPAMSSFPLQEALFTRATFFLQVGNFPPLLTRLSPQSSQVFNFKTLILLLRWTISLLEWPDYQLHGLATIGQGPVTGPSSKGPVTTSTDQPHLLHGLVSNENWRDLCQTQGKIPSEK
jgi:hypothetical protein